VYRLDPRDPRKQRRARDLLASGARDRNLFVPHQSVVEFYNALTRRRGREQPLLARDDARRQVEDLLLEFTILYPTEELVRTALDGVAAHGLPWYDAHLWAYAVVHGKPEILSEDFQDGRIYGTVRVVNPFRGL